MSATTSTTWKVKRLQKIPTEDGGTRNRWVTIGTLFINHSEQTGTIYLNHMDEVWKVYDPQLKEGA